MIAGHHQGLCSQSYLGFVDEEHETAKRRHLKSCCLEKEKKKKKTRHVQLDQEEWTISFSEFFL